MFSLFDKIAPQDFSLGIFRNIFKGRVGRGGSAPARSLRPSLHWVRSSRPARWETSLSSGRAECVDCRRSVVTPRWKRSYFWGQNLEPVWIYETKSSKQTTLINPEFPRSHTFYKCQIDTRIHPASYLNVMWQISKLDKSPLVLVLPGEPGELWDSAPRPGEIITL